MFYTDTHVLIPYIQYTNKLGRGIYIYACIGTTNIQYINKLVRGASQAPPYGRDAIMYKSVDRTYLDNISNYMCLY